LYQHLPGWARLTGRQRLAAPVTGLTRGSGKGEIARATLDAMALQNVDILMAMEADIGKPHDGLKGRWRRIGQ
jgi:glycerol kinase